METIVWLLHTPVVRGALAGTIAAALTDLDAFLSWRDVHQFATYDWGTALLRWAQGAVSGALTGAGIGALHV